MKAGTELVAELLELKVPLGPDNELELEEAQTSQLLGSTVADRVLELDCELAELLDLQPNQPFGLEESLSLGLPHAKLFEMVVLLLPSLLPV